MDDPCAATSLSATGPDTILRAPQPRWMALVETVLVCGIPTQLIVAGTLIFLFELPPQDEDGLSLQFFATLSFVDTALVAWLIRMFLRSNGERPRDVFLGFRPIWPEVRRGLLLVVPVLVGVAAVVWTLRTLFPWLHTVEHNPLEAFMDSPAKAAVFLVVVVIAGGVREELQRAFVLHRFEQRLGGIRVGLVLFTFTFGLLHLDQGADVAMAVGLLGLLWGVIYIRRRSAVLAIVNHAGFNAMQVAQTVLVRSFGG